MRKLHKWYLSISVLGVGGLTALALSPAGRDLLRWAAGKILSSPQQLQQWNDNAERELRRIEAALDNLAESVRSAGSFTSIPDARASQ